MENIGIGTVLAPVAAFMAGAILVEALTGFIRERFQRIDAISLSMILGILLAFYGRFNILTLAGLEFGWAGNPILEGVGVVLGILFSGVVLSRGSNAVHDLLSKLKGNKELAWAKKEAVETEEAVMIIQNEEITVPNDPAFDIDPTDPEY